ncbi:MULTISPECIES: hypothetical protein [unclassified Clostridium]|nr:MULTISPECIES: hypothetical protein [unclassified Clostridium]
MLLSEYQYTLNILNPHIIRYGITCDDIKEDCNGSCGNISMIL